MRFAVLLALLISLVRAPRSHASDSRPAEIEEILRAFHQSPEGLSGAALVAQDDQVLYRGAFGLANVEHAVPNTPDTRFRLASLSKTFTAAAVLRLVDDGEIELEEVIGTYLPELPNELGSNITVRQLLCHRAGLYRDTLTASLHGTRNQHHTLTQLVELIGGQELLFDPGEHHSYSSPGYVLLAAIVGSVTGQTYGAALRHLVLDPLALNDTGVDRDGSVVPRRANRYQQLPDGIVRAPHQDVSFATGAGDLYSTVDDLHRFGRALATGEFLSAETRERMFTDQGSGYGLGLRVNTYVTGDRFDRGPGSMISHDGGTSGVASQLRVFLDHGVVLVLLANVTEVDLSDIANRVGNVALGLDRELPRPNRRQETLEAIVRLDPAQALQLVRNREAPDRPRVGQLFRLGFALHQNHRPEQARRVATLLTRVWRESEYPYVLLGKIEERLNPAAAATAYRTALQRNPRCLSAARGLERIEAGSE